MFPLLWDRIFYASHRILNFQNNVANASVDSSLLNIYHICIQLIESKNLKWPLVWRDVSYACQQCTGMFSFITLTICVCVIPSSTVCNIVGLLHVTNPLVYAHVQYYLKCHVNCKKKTYRNLFYRLNTKNELNKNKKKIKSIDSSSINYFPNEINHIRHFGKLAVLIKYRFHTYFGRFIEILVLIVK